jgi:hypothetical protein
MPFMRTRRGTAQTNDAMAKNRAIEPAVLCPIPIVTWYKKLSEKGVKKGVEPVN